MSLDALLSPKSIAVVGASDNPKRIGGVPVDLLKRAGFARLYPVNPKNATVQGLTAYADIESVPEVVDLVIVALSAEATLPYLERCHALGIPAALVFASGYAETNEPEGLARQEALTAFARASGMKIAGPNAMGNANFSAGVFTTFGQSFQPGEPAGATALVTQSGNMCATVFRLARRAGVTFSQVINTGNEASVELSDYLEHLADDPATSSALCYIEELRNGPKFLAAAAKFRAAGKLLAVYKVGASEKGAEATRSHTAALAGDSAAYDAAFARAGVARAGELSVLADLAYLHGLGGKIGGSNCAILSISGAAGAILADALALNGAEVPSLPAQLQAALSEQIPGHSMVSNPIDMTGNIVNSNDFLSECIRLALSPDDIDLLLLYTPGAFLALDQVEKAAAASNKAIVVIDTFAMADRDRLAAAGIGYFDDFDRAARAIAAYGAWKKAGGATVASPKPKANWPVLPADRNALSETEGKDALAAFGVPVVHDALVQTAAEAREAAEKIGYPLVAKLVSPDIAHKTEHGLIRLGLEDADAVALAFRQMMTKALSMSGVRIEGVTLEPMLQGGVEILAGVTRDPVFGWMLTVGLGGVWTELMQDATHALLPVDAAQAEAMLRSLKGFKLLDGYRGAPRADVAAAAKAIAALGEAVLAGGERLREVEINPLLVLPEGKGAVAVDALVLLNEAEAKVEEPA
ncbi:acetate--CoA ligase family protein [Novosphingobium sp. JCM 18896]|uniref:acetate--CoA ligase family protein n=1 Tax=Novosphingobium sp. JCM 18896 TaxID=2989731 RepID=UPI002223DF04|nr:acetate--CoA ligase family protein [Novosphingobium sp. JCM 18896]MCW1428717.1 acetate--CoA ligase family protein [Novosphingobium sp. JCM 18896]